MYDLGEVSFRMAYGGHVEYTGRKVVAEGIAYLAMPDGL
jgi:hypothetical protein